MSPFQTILHPTDFSEYSAAAFRYACSLAETTGARLILLHVHETASVVFGDLYPVPVDLATARETLQGQLLDVVPPIPTIPVERHVVEGYAAEEIVRFAEEHHCDLIVIGTHGRTGLRRLLLGSVAEKVLRKAPCPVLTVRVQYTEAPEAAEPAGAAIVS
jgi:nucleotide-binding universal stress UspA family protein